VPFFENKIPDLWDLVRFYGLSREYPVRTLQNNQNQKTRTRTRPLFGDHQSPQRRNRTFGGEKRV
jgi:hypothetical protein